MASCAAWRAPFLLAHVALDVLDDDDGVVDDDAGREHDAEERQGDRGANSLMKAKVPISETGW